MLLSALSLHNRFTQLTVFAICLLGLVWFLIPSSFEIRQHLRVPGSHSSAGGSGSRPHIVAQPRPNHPIDHLIQQGEAEFNALLAKETKTLSEAAEAYRRRRGRQPPPWFDKWFHFASNHSALIVEDLWDRIYEDLAPFWGVPAVQMREQANDFLHRISVRNGNATGRTDEGDRPWVWLWTDMVQSVAMYLPDLDIPLNHMDESRIVVPWEEIDKYMQREQLSRKIIPANKLKKEFGGLKDLDEHPPPKFEPLWDTMGPYWQHAVVGCPPDSPARNAYIETDFSRPPRWVTGWPKGSYEGYVQNWTFAKLPCEHLEMQGMQGSFIEPISIANTKTFFPLFGACKLPMNNEILFPPAMYWTDDPFYSGGEEHGNAWKMKRNKLIWRGTASGGRNKESTWTRFQRHRFVAMINATSVRQYSLSPQDAPPNFVLPANNSFELSAQQPGTDPSEMSEWVATWSDAELVNLECFPPTGNPKRCPHTDQYFSVADVKPMKEQYNMKYLPDIDGNSYSGRYRGFLGSTSMPIKSTIYHEWHDSRLVPWKHFVPMDHTYIDIYGIMEYFVGNRAMNLDGHDEKAKAIALSGKEWAEKVLRKEDMSIYMLRLLLEYARLCDDDREVMGWAETGD